MSRINADSPRATRALELVEWLQGRLVDALEALGGQPFGALEWLRDDGLHGGGVRYGLEDSELLGRASVNVSQVQYDDDPARQLASASALSTIVHPAHPRAPSVHIHISWTEQKAGRGYWRIMADLNPSIPNESDRQTFMQALRRSAPDQFDEAAAQGDRYFFIPALNRHRGVAHVYLENYNTGHFDADIARARSVGKAAMDTYMRILSAAVHDAAEPTADERAAQLAYHTLYFFQVLTLDRGTTMGLLVHNQNDIGILGSLPPRIDKNLLASWRSRMSKPQENLLDRLCAAMPNRAVCTVDLQAKQKLADAVRAFYRQFPEALALQASGSTTPPTLENHR